MLLDTDKDKKVVLSIIVPIYNVEKYLERCLDSLSNQSLKDIEILLIDDGSTDQSCFIAKKYSENNENFHYFKKNNGGLSDARNFGINKCKGEYIGFVDSDDWVENEMYKKMYDEAKLKNADIVVCNFWRHSEIDGINPIFEKMYPSVESYDKSVKEEKKLLLSRSYAWNKIFKKKFFSELGFRFPKGKVFEDSCIVYSMMMLAGKISIISEGLYHYVSDRKGAITNKINNSHFDIFYSMKSLIDSYKKYIQEDLNWVMKRLVITHIFARKYQIHISAKSEISRRFVKESINFLDNNIKDWRKSKTRYFNNCPLNFRLAFKYKIVGYIHLLIPSVIRKSTVDLHLYRKNKLEINKKLKKQKRDNKQKEKDLKAIGDKALAFFFRNLNQLGLTCFADFGTLLGLVRDGGFVANEKDIDIGVYGSNEEAIRTKEFFIDIGCQLWREYTYDNKIVELSFIYWGSKNRNVKVDLNFYSINPTNNTIKTYLFYQEPNKTYFGDYRDVVELNYTKPHNFNEIIFRNISIPIPSNATQILKEKYGEDWEKPNPTWIYWKSPSAIKQINKLGTFKNYPIKKTDIEILEKNILDLQKRQLKIIKFILKTCEEFKLTVMAAEGTLLGAIRNSGFIPWDEDVDLMMPRKDYEILIKKIIKNPSPDFHLWNENTDRKYPLPFIKFVANDSGPFENVKPKDIDRKFSGPRLDIFPVDEIFYSENIIPKIQNFLITIFRKALIAKRSKRLRGTFLRKLIVKLISFWPYNLLHKLIKESATFQSNFIFKYLLVFNKNKSKKSFLVNWMSLYNYKKEIFDTIDFKKTYILFEKNTKIPIPVGYDKILKNIYGDYMVPKKIIKSSHGIRYRVNKDFKI